MRTRTLLVAGVGLSIVAGAAWFLFLRSARADHLVADPAELEFGRVVQGDTVERTLRLVNHGDSEVSIHDVQANCTCFQILRSFERYLHPGESAEVRVTLVTESELYGLPAGPMRGKKLTIVTSDPRARTLTVPISGDILAVRRVAPSAIDVGELVSGNGPPSKSEWRVTLRPGPGFQVNLVRAYVDPPDLFEVRTTEAEGGVDVVVALKPDAKGAGPFSARIVLESESNRPEGGKRRLYDAVPIHGVWK